MARVHPDSRLNFVFFNPFLRIDEPILDKFGCREVRETQILDLRHGHISRRSHLARTACFCSADLLPAIERCSFRDPLE